MAIEAEALLARLEAKAQEQIDYWRKRQAAEKALEDGVSEDGMSYTPMGDHTAWQAGYCNGRMSEADWWLQTLTLEIPDLIRSALAEDTARAAEGTNTPLAQTKAQTALKALTWDEAVTLARRAIYDTDGRGMIARNRNYLQDRVAREIRNATLALTPEAADANR